MKILCFAVFVAPQSKKVYFLFVLIGSSQYELFEGDMLLTKEQIEAAKKGQNPMGGGARGLSRYGKWPGGIVYYTIDTRK